MRFIVLASLSLWLLAAPAHADITFAAVGPVTGQDAAAGEQFIRGATAAVDAINASGGLLGQHVNLVVKDDACDPKQAVAIANSLNAENTAAVIGHFCSGSSIPAAKVYNEEGVLMISPASTSPALTGQGLDNVFRVCGRDDQQGAVVGEYIARHYAKAAIAIVNDKTAYGQGLAEEVRKSLKQRGVAEKMYETVSRGERDYGSLVTKLKENKIDILFFGGYHPEAGLIVRQMREQGMPTVLIGGEGLVTDEFWAITGDAGEGTLMSFNPDPRQRPEAAAAVKALRVTGYEPEGYTLYTYAAVQIAAEAIRRAGKPDIAKLVPAMHQAPFGTVLGDIAFDAHGDVTKPDYIIYRWTKGSYVPVDDE